MSVYKLIKQRHISINTLTSLLTASFFSTLLLTPGSYIIPLISLFVLSLILLPKTKSLISNKIIKIISFSLIGYFLLYLIFFFIHDERSSYIDAPSRALLSVFVLLLLVKYPPKVQWIFYAIPIGAIVAGLIAFYHLSYPAPRAFISQFGYMVIQSGGMCAWLSLLSLISFIFSAKEKNSFLTIISIIGWVMGTYATIASGARGAIIILPPIILMIIWFYRTQLSKKIILAICVAFLSTIVISYPQLSPRINKTVNAAVEFQNGNSVTSSGKRIEMWKSAIITATRYPILGYSHERINEEKLRQVEEGLINPSILKYSRAHNQFFEELQSKGIVGLISILLIYIAPIVVFYKGLKHKYSRESYAINLMGLSHIISLTGFSMTQHYLNHQSGLLLFAFGTVIFTALSINTSTVKESKW